VKFPLLLQEISGESQQVGPCIAAGKATGSVRDGGSSNPNGNRLLIAGQGPTGGFAPYWARFGTPLEQFPTYPTRKKNRRDRDTRQERLTDGSFSLDGVPLVCPSRAIFKKNLGDKIHKPFIANNFRQNNGEGSQWDARRARDGDL
jgi:hypothetical protein